MKFLCIEQFAKAKSYSLVVLFPRNQIPTGTDTKYHVPGKPVHDPGANFALRNR